MKTGLTLDTCLSEKCREKNISADEAAVKQQQIKDLVAVFYNFL